MPDQPPPAVAPRRYSGGALVACLAAGFVAAAVICVALAAGGLLPGQQKGSGGGSKAAITLPARILSYVRLADAKNSQSDAGRKSAAADEVDARNTAAALSTAHGGAGAAVENYSTDDLTTFFSVWAVRDATPPPVVAVLNADRLELAVAPQVVRTFGDVSCEIRYQSIPKGQPITPDNTYTALCQRSSSSLTVTVYGPTGALIGHPDKAAAIVDAVWSKLT